MKSYRAPTPEQVKEALRRIPTMQLRRAFYEGLHNPLWLEPLKKEGAFKDPPRRVTMVDGSTGDPYWPEIEYAVRVADEAPRVAVDILLGLRNSDNAWVRRALFAIGAKVPAAEAARLKPVLKAWLASGFGWRTDPREMVKFAVNLISGGERKTGEWVANALFRPGSEGASRQPDLVLEEYWYEAGLPEVVQALGATGLPMVLAWLVQYQTVNDELDGWSLSRPSIGERRDMHRDVEDALIDGVRDLAIVALQNDTQGTIDRLLANGLMLTRRIAMYGVTAALADTRADETRPALIEAATRLLFDPLSNDERCRVEYGELARAVAGVDRRALDPLVEFIAAGPILSASELRERLRRDNDETEADIDVRVAEFTERWEHSWLASVGESALPTSLLPRLVELDQRLGVIEDPLRPSFATTSWTGPNSPVTQEEMAAMGSEELVAHLESWHDLGDGWGPEPSHEGQARELTTLVSANPQVISGAQTLVARLRPTYLRAILRGWAAAYKASFTLDWEQVSSTIRGVLEHSDELDFPREGGNFDDDPDFTWAKQAAVSLLDDLVKQTTPARIPDAQLAEYANLLLELAESEAPWRVYADKNRETGMDPLTQSLNWQWPIRIRGISALVSYGPSATWAETARSILLAELNRADPQGASRAVIGESLGRFLNADQEWTESHTADWFGGTQGIDRGQQIALSTALAVHYYHRTLYRVLTPSMLAAIAHDGQLADGWIHHNNTPLQRIGEWAVKAMVHGDADWDDPLVNAFFVTADARDRGAALGRIAWEFMRASKVDNRIRDRFASVWDARISHVEANPSDAAELREFFWVVRCEKFDVGWWMPRFKRALQLDPELATERYMIAKDLAKASDVDPRGALDVAMLLVERREAGGLSLFDLSRNAIPMVIARALAAGNEQLADDATRFLNELGEAGQLDLARQVQAVLDGSITQQDVDE